MKKQPFYCVHNCSSQSCDGQTFEHTQRGVNKILNKEYKNDMWNVKEFTPERESGNKYYNPFLD